MRAAGRRAVHSYHAVTCLTHPPPPPLPPPLPPSPRRQVRRLRARQRRRIHRECRLKTLPTGHPPAGRTSIPTCAPPPALSSRWVGLRADPATHSSRSWALLALDARGTGVWAACARARPRRRPRRVTRPAMRRRLRRARVRAADLRVGLHVGAVLVHAVGSAKVAPHGALRLRRVCDAVHH